MGTKRIAIVGAGPIGLDAALAAVEAGFPFTLYEASGQAGGNVRSWGHVRLFTPWPLNVSPRARGALAAAGITAPSADRCPTGSEFADVLLAPIAALDTIGPHLECGARVLEIGRDRLLKSDEIGTGVRAETPFRLLVRRNDGTERVAYADVVLDCTGTYGTPNAMGVGGIHAPGERGLSDRIIRRNPDFERDAPGWAGRRILLVGAGHSGQTAAGELAGLIERAPRTSVVWAIRSEDPSFGAVENDALPARAALVESARALAFGAESPLDVRLGAVVEAVEASDAGIIATLRGRDGRMDAVVVDRIVSLTGSVPDATIYRQLQVHECWATSGPMKLAAALLASTSADCLTQRSHGADTLENPEPNFFILGEKSYGRNATFLMRVGWEQVDEVFSLIRAVPATARGDR